MAVRSQRFAKLTRPKLHDVLPRPRLFSLIDEATARPIVWVCAPPGAGKTTLVASYLEARGLRHLWYQADAGDGDPATFVHYMRIAAEQVSARAAKTLPRFNREPEQDLARFARSFFRELFSVLPRPCAIVVDNFHEMRESAAALAQGIEEIPDGFTLFVASRGEPPPEFARLVVGRRIARVDEAALSCTRDEAEAILAGPQLAESDLERICRQSEGWMSALVLMREHLSRHGATVEESIGEGKDAIFNYFAGEIFDGAKAENQRILMLTALAPSITPQEAATISGSEEAPRLLEYLYRRRLFVDRRRGETTTYHYHALFREFLLDRLASGVGRDERRSATVHVGHLLAKRGQVSDALALFRDADEWDAMRALIHAHALDWARQGRAHALSDWIEALPASLRARDPWLEYWFGRAWAFIEPSRGRPAVERAYAAFRDAGDLRGAAFALATMVASYNYEWVDFRPLDRWLPEFERLLRGERAGELDAASELRARAAWIVALLLRNPEDANLEACAQRLDTLLDGESDLNVRVMAASTLLNYINWKTEGAQAPALIARVQPLLASPEVTPLMQLWWRTHLAFSHYVNGRYGESRAVMSDARAIAARYGLEAYLFEIDHAETSALVNKGDYAAAKALLDATERRLSPARRMHWPYFHHVRSMLEQRLDHVVAAAAEAQRAVDLAREAGLPAVQLPHFLARLAQARAAMRDREGAMRAADEAIALASPFERAAFEQRRQLLQIETDLDAGDTPRAATALAAVLAEYRLNDRYVFMRSRPDLAARFADFALAQGIEVDFVRRLIERNGLVAPLDASAAWPFRLRIRALGGFVIVRDGEPLRFTGKAQQRPLDLLKLLVVSGGADVDVEELATQLWPDADGDAARVSFGTTLFRLRKLLDAGDVLVVSGGKLSLAPQLAWTDVRALEVAIESAEDAGSADAPARDVARAAQRLLDASPGPLLGSEEAPWIARPRDALRARFVRSLMRLGEELERRREWRLAVDVYRRGLEADNLSESFYRGLMRALAASGDPSEALVAFRRCRELLSIVLGVKPSSETERLYREIASGGTPALVR